MTLRHFRIYTAVYTERNMTGAARKLFMSQPSVSQVIKELEDHYKVVLFERFPRELIPTPSGDRLFEYATNILEMNAELEDLMKQGSSQQQLRIGANDTAGSTIFEQLIKDYTASHPLEKLQVNITRSHTLTELLRTNDLDLAITDEFQPSNDLISEIILEDDFICVVSPFYPNIPKDRVVTSEFLEEARLLMREPGTDQRDYTERFFKQVGYNVLPYWESISFDILLNATLQEMGVCILPRNMVQSYLESGRLIELTIPNYKNKQVFHLAFQKNKYMSEPIEDFVKLCRKIEKEK